jgi:hypothetical protein
MIGPWIKSACLLPFVPQSIADRTRTAVAHGGLHMRRYFVRRGYTFRDFERRRCIFVHVPKAAGIAVSDGLFGNRGGGHLTILDYRRIFQDVFRVTDFSEYFTFAFVRNPWDRCLSAFSFLSQGGLTRSDKEFADKHVRGHQSFNAFVSSWMNEESVYESIHLRPQTSFICDEHRQLAVKFVGRFENLNADYEAVRQRLGIGEPLRKVNRSRHGAYTSYYDRSSVDKIARIYQREIEMFGYDFGN